MSRDDQKLFRKMFITQPLQQHKEKTYFRLYINQKTKQTVLELWFCCCIQLSDSQKLLLIINDRSSPCRHCVGTLWWLAERQPLGSKCRGKLLRLCSGISVGTTITIWKRITNYPFLFPKKTPLQDILSSIVCKSTVVVLPIKVILRTSLSCPMSNVLDILVL